MTSTTATIDRAALFAEISTFKSDNTPTWEKLEAASEEEVQELAQWVRTGECDRGMPRLMERFASFSF